MWKNHGSEMKSFSSGVTNLRIAPAFPKCLEVPTQAYVSLQFLPNLGNDQRRYTISSVNSCMNKLWNTILMSSVIKIGSMATS